MKTRLAIGSAVLLTIAFIVNTVFLRGALTDGYQVSEIKRLLISMEYAGNQIARVIGSNDRRMSVSEMREILARQQRVINRQWMESLDASKAGEVADAGGLVNLSIVLKSGSKLVSTAREDTNRELPSVLVEQILEIGESESVEGLEFVEDNDHYYVPFLLFDDQQRWFVSLIFEYRKSALRPGVSPWLEAHTAPTLLLGLFSVFVILLFYFCFAFRNRVSRQKDFVIDFVLIMLVTLMCSLLINAVIFERQILEASIRNAQDATSEISTRLSNRLSLKKSGIDSSDQKFEFSETFSRFDNFETILLTDTQGKPIYRAADNRAPYSGIESMLQAAIMGRLPDNRFQVEQELSVASSTSKPVGTAVIHISKDDIFRNWISMIIDGITILFVTILVMVECLLLYLHLLVKGKSTGRARVRFQVEFVRPAMFLLLFAIDLSMSFVPLHMRSFDAELFGLSRDIVLGLPISAEFLCVGIFLLVAGVWIDRRGWHEPYFVGLVIVGIGSLCSWVTTDALMFILSRALVGIGYGLTLMSAQGLVVSFGGKSGRARGFASLFAGLYSGSICGAAAGAFLAERYGYEKVFFMGAVIVLVLVLFSAYFMFSLIDRDRKKPEPESVPDRGTRLKPLLKFICNPVFIALSLLSSLPASIAVAGFMHFFTPVYLDQIGWGESTIGQVLILYGLCLIYFGPSIGRMIDRSQDKKYYVLIGGLLGGLAFVTFSTDFGILSMILSVFLLGLSSSFVLSSQSIMVLELEESKVLGEGKALGIFRSISRIGQVVGPLIFGWVLVATDLTEVVNYLGYAYIGGMAVLAVFVMKRTGAFENQKAALSS